MDRLGQRARRSSLPGGLRRQHLRRGGPAYCKVAKAAQTNVAAHPRGAIRVDEAGETLMQSRFEPASTSTDIDVKPTGVDVGPGPSFIMELSEAELDAVAGGWGFTREPIVFRPPPAPRI